MATTDTQQTAQFAAQAAVSAAEAKQYLLSIQQPVIDISESVDDAQNAAAAAEMARDQAQGISTELVQTIDSQLSAQEIQFENQMTDQQSSFDLSQTERDSSFEEKSNEFESRFSLQLSTQESTFSESQTDKENRFQQFLLSSGYVFLGDYENGPFQFSARNQYIQYNNQYYRLNAATDVGFTTTGTDATSFTNDVTHFVLMDGDTIRQNLGSNEEDLGIALLGLPGSGSLKNIIGKWTSPEAWGVITDSQSDAHANSKKMFNMFEWLRSLGGGVAYFTPGKTYWIDFIQFVPSNVVIIGYGATVKQINPLSMYGRGGFVFGSGREWNYQKAKAAYNSGNYPSSVADSTMAELPLKSYLRDNQSYVQCEKCKVYGLRMSAVFTDSSYWGGYAFNCVNAQHIRFFDVVGDGWTQLFNFGNDSIASSPSCYDVIARGSTIEKPDLVRTYYAYGFMANSTDCWIEDSNLLTPMTAGTLNGSGAAVNMVENCGFRNLTAKKLGRTVSSEMVLLNNAKGCLVENIDVGDCINGVATYYTDDSYNDLNMPNVIRNISAEADNVIALRAKYAIIDSFHGKGAYINELYFANNNASENKINKNPKSIGFGGTNLQSWFLTNNTVLGWFRRYFYLRPSEIILNDKSDTLSWTFNKLVSTKNGVDLYFMWRVPDDIKAIDDIRAFIRFNISPDQNAAAAGSTVEASLIQMISFDGDINTAPYTAFSNSKVAASGVENTTIVTQMGSTAPGFVKMADETHGLAYSWYVLFKMTHNVNNNYMKEIRIAGYN